MGYLCEVCEEQRSIVYCRSDAASLCLSCDRNVHSANALSQRHSRTLICERCNSQPAVVRCIEEKTSLCQSCDWSGHASTSSSSMHKRQALSSYKGCPSVAELSNILSFQLDDPSVGDTCEQRMGSMSINDNRSRTSQGPQAKDNSQDMCDAVEASDMHISDKSTFLMESSMPTLDNKSHNVELPFGSTNSASSKGFYMGAKGSSLFEDDPFYENLIMDEVDMSIENYEELFGASLNYPDELFENENLDGLFGTKDITAADSSCRGANTAEGSSTARVKTMQPTCSNAASADSVMSCKTDSILCFARQAQSTLSISNYTGESSAGDHQDCGASPVLLMGEPPWGPPCPEISSPSTSRSNAVLRYKEKKKTRKFDKQVRYVSRKERADVRRRVKGRFIKAGGIYDYDPLSQTRSY